MTDSTFRLSFLHKCFKRFLISFWTQLYKSTWYNYHLNCNDSYVEYFETVVLDRYFHLFIYINISVNEPKSKYIFAKAICLEIQIFRSRVNFPANESEIKEKQ